MSIKIAGCIILYNPEQSVEQNITSYIKHLEKVYIVDNTEITNYNHGLLSTHQSKIVSIHDGKNEGIAQRLNEACALAINDGFEYLLTMDQDSFFAESAITRYIECIERFDNRTQIAMFGVNYQFNTKKETCDIKKVNFLITSGSIINLALFKQVGSFDENLFIDFVDTEYCFRSIEKGYDIIELPNIFMHHSLGESFEKRSLKNFKKDNRSLHSSLRLYYMSRNFLYINFKYDKSFKTELWMHKKDLLHRIKNNLLYRSGRFKTISLLLKAYRDFKHNKMGKLSA